MDWSSGGLYFDRLLSGYCWSWPKSAAHGADANRQTFADRDALAGLDSESDAAITTTDNRSHCADIR